MGKKCQCAYAYCCDACWKEEARQYPCSTKGCENPKGHAGSCGKLKNTQTITLTESEVK